MLQTVSAARRFLPYVAFLALLPLSLGAQVSVKLTLPKEGIANGNVPTCDWSVTRLKESAAPDDPLRLAYVSDTLVLRVVDDSSATGDHAPVVVQVQGVDSVYRLASGDSVEAFAVGVRALASRQVRIGRDPSSGAKMLCIGTPAPVFSQARDLGRTHHDLFAGGEVSSALRTGAAPGAATGNLGLHTFAFRPAGSPFRFPFGFVSWLPFGVGRVLNRVGYDVEFEELRTAITVTGTGDTLSRLESGKEFAQAVLAPLSATRGTLSSVQVMYSPQQRYGSSRKAMRGLRLSAAATRSVWSGSIPASLRDPNAGATAVDTVAKDVTLFTGDARWRWVFINHDRDDDGNTFSFAADLGWTARGIRGDIAASGAANDSLRVATLGSSAKSFHGPVVGLYLTLRQVSAYAEVQKLRRTNDAGSERVESLEGWQPLIGFRFEAPIFTILDK